MISVLTPIVGRGQPIEVRADDFSSKYWSVVSGVEIRLLSDLGETINTTFFEPQSVIEIPTGDLPQGSYDLIVILHGTPDVLSEPILIGAPNLQDRVRSFIEALESEGAARKQSRKERFASLRTVKQVYSELGLANLVQEVNKELLPFDYLTAQNGEHWAHGTRKRATVRARLRVGTGSILVSTRDQKIPFENYFVTESQRHLIRTPLFITELSNSVDVLLNCSGGGKQGQASAGGLAIAKAIVDFDIALRPQLKGRRLLTTDARNRERKKPGQPGARKKSQFSKR